MIVHENNESHLSDFIKLNEAWIVKYFSLEEADLELAKDPQKIIRNNGYVFSVVMENDVVGVCALFNKGNGFYELARMAVSEENQGKGYGKVLLNACLSKAKELNAKNVYLVSNTILEPAIKLYKQSGFVTVKLGQDPVYSRANILMELKALSIKFEPTPKSGAV